VAAKGGGLAPFSDMAGWTPIFLEEFKAAIHEIGPWSLSLTLRDKL
jgi:hypothetical protein